MKVPVLICAGENDPLLPLPQIQQDYENLKEWGVPVTLKVYPTKHQVSDKELEDVLHWIGIRLPRNQLKNDNRTKWI
jgi:predicted esterase